MWLLHRCDIFLVVFSWPAHFLGSASRCSPAAARAASPARISVPSPSNYEVSGIDVSKYQGDIDWNSVRAAGVRFAWIKATEGGDRVDEKFAQNWAAAKAAGVPRGAYHFAYWCRPMEEQAAWFTAHVPK